MQSWSGIGFLSIWFCGALKAQQAGFYEAKNCHPARAACNSLHIIQSRTQAVSMISDSRHPMHSMRAASGIHDDQPILHAGELINVAAANHRLIDLKKVL